MTVSRNAPCPCGSGNKYKKCCLTQDEKAAAEAREQRQVAEAAEEAAFMEYATQLDELTNRANDLIRSEQWTEAEACCHELVDRFPKEIDGHHHSYEYYKARGDLLRAKTHAEATLAMVESQEGFDPDFPAELKEDIAAFDDAIQANLLPD